MPLIHTIIFGVYYSALTLLVLYGAHRLHLAIGVFRRGEETPADVPEDLPKVTLQLPMFNERHVAERLLRASAAIEYPKDRLQIQVLDDSTDDTTLIVDRVVDELRRQGQDIVAVRRPERTGYKAGALEYGLAEATGEFIAIFDADFVPEPGFLRDLIGHFSDPEVGMVQARWGHLNRTSSLLTRAQAVLLDGHFVMEQTARARAGHFFNFNGTAGIWRRQAIDDAGGWEHDTITEDLDLSYRAQINGWKFVYRTDVVAPAELPAELHGFKTQQHRWAKGSIECFAKLFPRLLRSDARLSTKLEGAVHLTANLSYVLMLVVALTMPVVTIIRQNYTSTALGWADLALFGIGFVSVATFYAASLRRLGFRWWYSLVAIPAAIALDIGLCVHKSRAVVEALARHRTEFVRTPKMALVKRRRLPSVDEYLSRRLSAGALELVMAGWMFYGVSRVCSGPHPSLLPLPFLLLFGLGFLFIGLSAVVQGVPFARLITARRLADRAG